MKNKESKPSAGDKKDVQQSRQDADEQKAFPGYPVYPESEDIYNNEKQVKNPDPDDYPGINNRDENLGKMNEKDFNEDVTGDDLDVPGAELDDDMEEVGSEDEENNYYSLGGDDHDDLEEDRGE